MKKILSIILTLSVVLTPNGNVCTAHETVPATSIQTSGENQSTIKGEISKKASTAMKSLKEKFSTVAKSVKEFAKKNKKTITWSSMGAIGTALLGCSTYEFYRLMKDKGLLDFIDGGNSDVEGGGNQFEDPGKKGEQFDKGVSWGQCPLDGSNVYEEVNKKENNTTAFLCREEDKWSPYSELYDNKYGDSTSVSSNKWLTYAGYAGGTVAGVLVIGAAAYFGGPLMLGAMAAGYGALRRRVAAAKVARIL